jgi:thiosulfate sulfurtransferase
MGNFENISLDKAKEIIKQETTIIADIRDINSFKSGHIQGAIHLSSDNLQDFIQDNDPDHPVIVCCYHGHSSQPAAQYLSAQGFERVYSLIGGYTAWSAEEGDSSTRQG